MEDMLVFSILLKVTIGTFNDNIFRNSLNKDKLSLKTHKLESRKNLPRLKL